jgi:cephalosporin hydroxylase
MIRAMDLINNEINLLLECSDTFPASIHLSTAQYLYQLVLDSKPSLIVEIGCHAGFSTLHLAKAIRMNGNGKLLSFDLDTSNAKERIKRANLCSVVEFVEGNSAVMGHQMLCSLSECIDILFIDGDHTRRGCVRDIRVFLPFLKKGGLLVLHDTRPDLCGWLGPKFMLDVIKRGKDAQGNPLFAVDELTIDDPYGVAACKKLFPGVLHIDSTCCVSLIDFYYATSRLAQFVEIAKFEGYTTPLQMFKWGLSKWRRIASHW